MGRITLSMSSLFHNTEQVQSYIKNNCEFADYTGSVVQVTVAAGLFTSGISQADADGKAIAYLQLTGQDSANEQGICIQTTFWNSQQLQVFTPVCQEYYQGDPYTYIVPSHTYSSQISQQDADNKALAQIASLGQSTANAQGICTQTLFPNQQQSEAFYRNNCGDGYTTSDLISYTVPAATYFGATQEISNQLALNNIAANGQTYANSQGTCLGDPSVFTYQMVENNPDYADLNLYFETGGVDVVEIFNDDQGLGGSFSDLRIGDTVIAKMVSMPVEFPWPANARARMIITNKGVVVYDSGFISDQSNILLDYFQFTIQYGDQYHINAYTETTAFVAYPFKWIPDEDTAYCEQQYTADETGVVMVDIFGIDPESYTFVGTIETPGVEPVALAHINNNFVDAGSTPEMAWMLSSDMINQSSLKHRFAFNIAKLMNFYPSIEVFTFKVKGRGLVGSSSYISGQYSLKGADQGNMIMTGGEGTYIPTTSGASNLGLVPYYSMPIAVDGTQFDPNNVAEFLTFTYNRTTKALTLS